ncbi:uncharacterized protein LOC129787495 isoform X4 [Lutzomyia longipalpis]|uniref:uncharacterized protein LOC129787495 isoform X4 n=1 Tax=Lutzomyia longipalpis TaxID=7200 RepID=UPI002483E6BE|nr:uncharacterized protein LOC129787495 isoform X4 [Lutzomyia longipalpis]
MFTCLWQLWDWLDPPPLFTTATMESKKLQQLQQGNTHMASQPMPQTKAPSYHTTTDYRPQHSPVFQNHPQYQSLSSNFAQINMTSHQQPHLHVKPIGPGAQYGGTGFTQPQTPSQHLNHYHGEQLYQNNTRERLYHQAPLRQHYASSHQHINPSTQLQQQYQQLQQAKLQAQLQTQSDALIQQQRTFALRQQLNPPVPHYHLQSQTSLNQIPVQVQPQSQAQSMHRSAPPSSLNLTNQYQPDRTGKLPPDSHYGTTQAPANQLSPQSGNDDWLLMQSKESVPMPADYFTGLTNAALLQNHKAQSQAIYQQNQLIQQQMIQNKLQQQKSPQDQIIIQQNNPGSVMNQACQTQISGQVPKAKQQQQQNVEKTPSPSHAPLDRKKSGGTPIALKSPVTKRPASSPVTLSGWLYKQGSDGLKVWRKRWFVLSDYCLFYYKGPEEEKLLGSILLPSYRVGACSPEDKIYRKYAFKCEHVNMRTYWLAAETAESMGQWVRALTAATMMQCSSESDQTPQPSMSSSQNPSGENSDSGIHTYQSQQSKIGIPGTGHGPLTPASDGIGGGSSAGGSATGGGPQPLYANAPPKPKRANDGGYSSPSPEHSVERYDGGFDGQHLDANQRRLDVKSPLSHQSPDSLYEVRRQMAKSPDPALASRMQQIRLEGTKSPNAAQQQVRSPYPSENAYGQELGQNLFMRQHVHPSENVEDVYGGRENIIRAPHRFDDYAGRQLYGELNEREMQLRMAQQKYHQSGAIPGQQALYPNNERRTPDTYGRSRSGQDRRNFADYEDIYNLQQQAMGDLGSYRRPMSPIGYQNNKSTPGRYTPNYLEPNTAAQHVQMRARPVQSTLIPRPHSADFLEYEARSAEAAQMQAEPARAPRPKSSLDINRAPDSYYYSEASYAEKLRQSALYQTKPSTMPLRYSGNPFAADMANTIPRESDYNQRAYRQQQQQQLQKGFISQQQEQFLRSASARLPRKEEEANGRDCERRREESMKRLLEWKQRMLQSPLTRKGATLSATSTMNQSKSPIPMNSGLQRSRSETHTNAGYNSYSSDDEDGAHFSPAGRSSSPRTLSSSSALVSQNVQNTPVAVSQPNSCNNSRILPLSADTCQSPITYTPVYAQKSVTDTLFSTRTDPPFGGSLSLKRQHDDAADGSISSVENEKKNPDMITNQAPSSTNVTPTNPTVDEQSSQIDESGPSDTDKAFEYTDDDLDEALLAEIDPSDAKTTEMDEPKTPTNPIPGTEDFSEGHYLPMTPKKSLLSSSASESSIVKTLTSVSGDNSDENTYVEMTKGNMDSILADDVKSNYELMCLTSNSKLEPEPVYMELSQLKSSPKEVEDAKPDLGNKKSTMKKYQNEGRKFSNRMDLPDILKASQNVLKSDSSDADDEASKDFDGIEMKSRTRFSLSDTFRPASYYLGASTSLAECADSSDSEIASPPPIPTSPPPMEELNTEEIFSSENYDTVKRKDKQTLNNSYDQIPKLSSSDFHLNKTEGHKTSRLSLPDQFGGKKQKIDIAMPDYISLSTYNVEGKMYAGSVNSCNTDDGSNTSSDYDLYNKLKLESPSFSNDVLYNSDTSLPSKYHRGPRQRNSESETDSVELRHTGTGAVDLELERRLKRRPLSEDSFSEIESIENDFREAINTDLDQYLNKLTTNNPYIYNSNEQTNWMHESLSKIGDIHYIKPPEVFCSENDSFYENLNAMRKEGLEKAGDSFQIGQLVSSAAIQVPLRPDSALSNTNGTYYDSLEDKPQGEELPVVTTDANVSPLKEKNLSIHNAKCESEDLKTEFSIELSNSVTLSSADVDQQSTCTAFDLTRRSPVHSRGNSNVSDGSAPYYYSDLVSRSNQDISLGQKLNNQRDVGVMRKTGISHIHNPIHQRTPSGGMVKEKQQQGLATSDGRSISAEILNVATKEQLIDRRNLFGVEQHESRKIEKNICKEGSFPTKLNSNEFHSRVNSGEHENASRVHKANNNNTHNDSSCNSNPLDGTFCNMTPLQSPDVSAGDQLWEEDTLWRESLRRVSHRHARSLDDLDRICHAKRLIQDTKSRGQLTRDVTYVNDNVAASTQSRSSLRKKVYRKKASDRKGSSKQAIAAVAPADCDENDVYVQLAVDEQSGDVYETLREDRGAFLQQRPSDADREKIRQWDAMSSGAAGGVLGTLNDTKGIRGQLSSGSDATDAQASLSVQNVKNVQSPGLSVKPNDAIDIQRGGHMSNNHEDRYPVNMVRGYEQQQGWHMKKSTSQRGIDQLERENAMRSLDMSAGDLLSRTHEELVLLLIQLRRQNSATARAIEQCCTDIHDVQNRIRTSDGQTKMDNINRLDALKQQLVDLEKQYEKSKPLVNLVDNMVKLGSLYRGPTNVNRHVGNESVTLDRLEFNQRVQERRLLQEERRHWDRLSPNHTELQSKVQQLYQLDQLLQEESGTLQSLQRDKEDLERALGGLRSRMQNGVGPPIAIEAARKQQHALERELSRVHQLLAENSKLEQTVAGNARLEQELLVLRQKLQASRDSRGSQTALSAGSGSNAGAPDSITYAGGATAVLESDILELRRVQQLVGDMQRQRQELSQAVRQLTENSNSLYQQIRPSDHQSNSKKRPQNSSWMETDLDSMISSDHSSNQTAHIEHVSTNPFLNQSLYIDTNSMHGQKTHENDIKASKNFNNHHELSDGVESSMDSDDLLEGNQLNGLSVQDKQEIKTVRIVKRESERRQRDRERTNSSSQNLDQVLEEENHLQEDYLNYARSKSLPRGYTDQGYDPFKGGESLKSPRVTSKGNTIYAPGPTIPGTSGKYSDYYNHAQMTNHYPVSMTERTEDPAKYYSQMTDKNYKATYGSTGELAGLKAKTESIQSLTKSIGELSPVFQSEAARQIIYEMSGSTSEENGEKVPLASKHRRAVPKEKRRHNTAPSNVIVKTMQQIQSENDMNRNNTNWRARDDLDMEVALRPRSNAPDVVRSALGPREKISENTIDKLLAAPSKILIPERYIPEQPPELSPEEKKRRQEKVEAIKKMLSEAPLNPSNDNVSAPPSQISAEKKQREHLLQLNQILAQQVMQMSKIVAEKAMATLPSKVAELTKNIPDDDQPSPTEPLPLYQQRDNYFT